jgi:tetratricopeptide (TPR) repeat protein
MDRALYRPLLLTVAVAALVAGRSAAADDPLREKAIKLNQTTGEEAIKGRIIELAKDPTGTKKLLAVAAKMVTEEKDKRPLNYTACLILAKSAHVLKDYDLALVFYRHCGEEAQKLSSERKIVEAFDGMTDVLFASKKYDDAEEQCRRFLDIPVQELDSEISQFKPFMLEKLVKVLAAKGKSDDALKLTEDLIEKDKGGWYFVHLKARVLQTSQRYADAADAYLEAIERLKKSTRGEEKVRDQFLKQIRYELSGVYVDLKQIDKASEQLEALLKDDPDNPTFLNDLGFIWADHDMKFDEAEKLIRKAIDKEREQRKKIEDLAKDEDVDSAAYLDSLGWVLYKKKDYKEAKKYLQDATKLPEGKHIEIYDHLADTHMALGEKSEAIKVWKDALALEKELSKRDQERKKSIEKKLSEAEKK